MRQQDPGPGLQQPRDPQSGGEVVERFTDATEDILAVHVRFFVSTDTRWRNTIFSQLTPVGNGPQGQQIWTMRMTDAALLIAQMQTQQGFRKLADERVEMVNGQVLTIRTAEPRTFAGGMQRESAAGQGYTPRADKLEESIILKLSPLLTFEGDSVDASIDLSVNTVRCSTGPRSSPPASKALRRCRSTSPRSR